MEINAGWATAGVAATSLIGGGLIRWVDNSLRSVRVTQKLLFEKLDNSVRETHDLRLHVAETYVSRGALKEQLAPIMEGLKEIRDELRQDRRDHGRE